MEPGLGPRVVWIYAGDLDRALDAATWLETTRELRRMGWNVCLLSIGQEDRNSIRGVRVRCLASADAFFLRQVIFHLKVLMMLWVEWSRADVIMFQEDSLLWILSLRLIRNIFGGPRPILVMDTRSLPMPPDVHESLRERIKRWESFFMNRLANRHADGRLAITKRLAEALHIPEEKLLGTWPSGAVGDLFSSSLRERRWPSSDEAIRLIYHGALHRERNLATLCKAVMRANAEGMAFSLFLVGDGTDRIRLMNLAAASKGFVRVVPTVPYRDVPNLLAEAHVGVVPFGDEEKFRVSSPIKLFEYMAAGMPILATRVVCHTDVVGQGSYALWAEEADESGLLAGLKRVWEARQALPKMGREAELASRSWSWVTSSKKLAEALERGMEGARCEHENRRSGTIGVR
jgi:glycosyltransferase involved in cell wall biosynthesis